MMMTEVADHKRPSHDGFVLRDTRGPLSSHNDRSGGKRPKTCDGGRGAATSAKEKDRMGERVAKLQQLVSPFGKVGRHQPSSDGCTAILVPTSNFVIAFCECSPTQHLFFRRPLHTLNSSMINSRCSVLHISGRL